MKISQELNDLIVEQIANENKNSNIYLQIASWFENKNLSGFGIYFKKQAADEIDHKNRLLEYLHKRTGANVKMLGIPEISLHINSLVDVGKLYVMAEEQTSASISKIIESSLSLGDYMTFQEMQWFIEEQTNEENEAQEFFNKASLINDDGTGIVIWNNQLQD